MRDRYLTFIDQIIADTLQGKIRSKEQVYRRLTQELEAGTGEIFERCLAERTDDLNTRLAKEPNELRQAKLTRQVRALGTLADAWARWQTEYQVKSASQRAVQAVLEADPSDRLAILIQTLDPNLPESFTPTHIQSLSQALQTAAEAEPEETAAFELRQMAAGLGQGLYSFAALEGDIVSWLYDRPQALGFGDSSQTPGPWQRWSERVNRPLPRSLFDTQAQNQPAGTVAIAQLQLDLAAWVEVVVLMRSLHQGLIAWFDSQPYNLRAGKNLAGVTHLVFALIWSELSSGFRQAQHLSEGDRDRLARGCFQISLQILRSFAQRDNFPLYGGVFAAFSGEGFRDTIRYLDQPLNAVENVQEKARILTVLADSQRWLNRHDRARQLHQDALALAREASDRPCEIANLCHLSRLSLHQADYASAVGDAQRALILARQLGDRQGEAHALANLGFSQVMLARQHERVTAAQLESSIQYLHQGQDLAAKLEDVHSQALCWVGLGVAYVAIEQPADAQQALTSGRGVLQQLGDRDLIALYYASLAEASYQRQQWEPALYAGLLGMYWLEQRQNPAWRSAAALVTILQGKLGDEAVQNVLHDHRADLIAQIGADGVAHLPTLLDRYRAAE
ncbi:MAG: tetratricopeptide repeat protein [Leptolyngbyaceae cyanobacterium T60_A2020_046]|nr:tetratricopeptide repeat protein [Leptolyngbyaceae cyanobacterium T60_A2020_046]